MATDLNLPIDLSSILTQVASGIAAGHKKLHEDSGSKFGTLAVKAAEIELDVELTTLSGQDGVKLALKPTLFVGRSREETRGSTSLNIKFQIVNVAEAREEPTPEQKKPPAAGPVGTTHTSGGTPFAKPPPAIKKEPHVGELPLERPPKDLPRIQDGPLFDPPKDATPAPKSADTDAEVHAQPVESRKDTPVPTVPPSTTTDTRLHVPAPGESGKREVSATIHEASATTHGEVGLRDSLEQAVMVLRARVVARFGVNLSLLSDLDNIDNMLVANDITGALVAFVKFVNANKHVLGAETRGVL